MTDTLEHVDRKNHPTSLRLRPVDVMALRYIAWLDAHENVSAAVRKIVDQRMRAEIGRDWESVVRTDGDGRSEPQVA